MKLSTFGFLTGRGLRNLGTHWAMTIACVASLAVCMSLNTMASLVEVNVDSMIGYLGRQNETVVFLDPACDDATAAAVGEQISAISGVTNVSYMSKQDVLNTYESYMEEYAALWDEFENDNPFKANYRVTVADLSQLNQISSQMETIPGVVKVTAPVEMGSIFVQIQEGVTRMGRAFVLVLMVVSVITVGSTIRLSVFARRREIEIMKYVGATNWLVTLPFLMEGLAIGLIAGVLSASSVLGLYYYLISAASGLSGVWEILLGTSLVPVDAVWSTVLTSSVAGGQRVDNKRRGIGEDGEAWKENPAEGAAAADGQSADGGLLPDDGPQRRAAGILGHQRVRPAETAGTDPVQHGPAPSGAGRRQKAGERRCRSGGGAAPAGHRDPEPDFGAEG